MNENAINELNELIRRLPIFDKLSKNAAKKILEKSRVIELPKGWTFKP